MKSESELLELYAEAYKARSVEEIKNYISPIIQYITPNMHPQLLSKNQFLALLQGKFDGQNKQIPIENEGILIVDNITTGKKNICINFCGDEYLFSIEAYNGLIARITISNIDNNKISEKKLILKRQTKDKPKINYLDSEMIIILEENDPNEVINDIIKTNYPYEICVGENFKPQYLIKLIKSGFYIMSKYINRSKILLIAMHHLSRSVLFFDHIHVKKSIKKYLSKYELKENTGFEEIVAKCIEKHDSYWLSRPLVDAIKEIHRMNNTDVTFISFGLYSNGKLVAGEFGTKTGRIYSSYSGYYEENNCGTVQMILTARYLKNNGYAFWDLGMPVKYKTTIGAKTINLKNFISIWRKYSTQPLDLNLEYEKYPVIKQKSIK